MSIIGNLEYVQYCIVTLLKSVEEFYKNSKKHSSIDNNV
jgi:hypothetical protein